MWLALSSIYANISEKVLKLFVDTCPICQQLAERKPKHVGAKKPILSNHFCDRIQVDLIDYSSDPQKNEYDVEMRWLMVVKDHFFLQNWFIYEHCLQNMQQMCLEN